MINYAVMIQKALSPVLQNASIDIAQKEYALAQEQSPVTFCIAILFFVLLMVSRHEVDAGV